MKFDLLKVMCIIIVLMSLAIIYKDNTRKIKTICLDGVSYYVYKNGIAPKYLYSEMLELCGRKKK